MIGQKKVLKGVEAVWQVCREPAVVPQWVLLETDGKLLAKVTEHPEGITWSSYGRYSERWTFIAGGKAASLVEAMAEGEKHFKPWRPRAVAAHARELLRKLELK